MSDRENVADTVARLIEPVQYTLPDGRTVIVRSANAEIEDVSNEHGQSQTKPLYISQRVTLHTVNSLIDYVKRFMGPETTVFGDVANNSLTAAIDYHGHDEANHVDHRAAMQLFFSEEWRLWTQANGRLMGQLEFARFLEENANDVAVPAAGDLLDVVRDLNAVRKVNFTKAVRTSSDNENFEYISETEAKTKGSVEIPTRFQLNIPVYFGENPVRVNAFLRWALVEDTGLKLGYALQRIEHVRQDEFHRIANSVLDLTGAHVVYGSLPS